MVPISKTVKHSIFGIGGRNGWYHGVRKGSKNKKCTISCFSLRSSVEVWYVFSYFVICSLIHSMNLVCLICARYILVPIHKELMFALEGDR